MEFKVKTTERLNKAFFLFLFFIFFGDGRVKMMWEEFHWFKFVMSLFTNTRFP